MPGIKGVKRSARTAQKMMFPIKDFFSKCDQIRRNLWSHLQKKSSMENFIFVQCRTASSDGKSEDLHDDSICIVRTLDKFTIHSNKE